jgi:putative hydrolase of the HAD superfamily
MITAVTFDFWNTIARVPEGSMTAARKRVVALACEEAGVEVEAELLARSLEDVGLHWEEAWAAGRHLHPREGAAMLARALGVDDVAEGAVAEAFLGAGRDVPLELAPQIGEALEALSERGMRIGIVSDVGFTGGELLRGLLEREGLLRHFSGWSFSDEVGSYKPSARSFEAALEALRAEPGRAMHVGDLRRTDVAGAAALGMRTARYTGFHDDPDREGGPEAEVVVTSHLDLVAAIDRLG